MFFQIQELVMKNQKQRSFIICSESMIFITQSKTVLGSRLNRYILSQLQKRYKIIVIEEFMQKVVASKGANYKQSQIFGYKGPGQRILEEDIITSVKFDPTGNYVSLGDKAGRVIIFQAQEGKKKEDTFDYYTEFQSHTREFDPLKSMEVDEEISCIHWLKPQGKYLKLATTNSRNVKIWKCFEKTQKKIVKSAGGDLNMPKLQNIDTSYSAEMQRTFPNKHLSKINSISATNNEQYLLTSDDAQVFMWSLQDPSKPYIVADLMQKQNIDQMKENITCSRMHPMSDSLFLYGSNKGSLRLGDLRQSANVDSTALNFKIESQQQKNYIYELISSYSSADFVKGGKYVVSRDYLTVKLWDVCNTKKPVSTTIVQQGLKSKLCEMVQNDCIFDRFNISASPDGNSYVTGNYNNSFHMIDQDGTNTQYELNYKKATISKPIIAGKGVALNKVDYERKTLAVDFNPKKNMVAVGSLNCFFIYSM